MNCILTKGDELCYVGFIKKHPHDSDSIIRIAFNNEDKSSKVNVKRYFQILCRTM